ncbi:hypothetical protein COO60DRAFT_1641474 [Scenedesmus sp. NREL 46B-D3]|nr:hypothetical protein COO60DRAFT_1641474 [Scenedesmus sp. NREL 46B-D3]
MDVPGVVEIQDTASANKVDDKSLRGEYTWVIENWSQIKEPKKYSENFEIGTHLWRLLVCPQGMNSPGQLSIYLDSPEAAFAPANLNPTASFKLSILNQKTPGQGDFSKESSHKWSQNETDWGFTQYMLLGELLDPERGFIVNDTVKIKVEITVQRDERYYYDSRKETGHVGLKNQGATCYMNSLLQYLYHLPYFRKVAASCSSRSSNSRDCCLPHATNENDEPSTSLPLALQSLFYKLQYSRTAVSTKDLTKSFGWSTMDAFMQHDVQELNRVLCEKLEEKMKGHTLNFIECVGVDYKSSRRESFMDLQLDVKGCPNIYDSFDRYTQVEMMDGENQYKAEGYGLQDARKGVLFDQLPPVLQLQLKRFEYDFARDTMVKINDRYEFFDELDLDREDGKYLSPQADRSVRNLYKLHSVLVHSGGVHGGHYYAYIRPDGKTWLKFDDTAVTIEDGGKALEEQFGGEDEPGGSPIGRVQVRGGEDAGEGPVQEGDQQQQQQQASAPLAPKQRLKFTKFSNAYMLVYVRLSDWQRYMSTVTKDGIAPYLLERLEAEQREKERRQKEKQEAHLYCHVRIATDADIAQQVGSSQWFDLVDYDQLPPSRTFRVRKLTRFSDFKQQVRVVRGHAGGSSSSRDQLGRQTGGARGARKGQAVAAELGVPLDSQRYWVWQQRANKTYRPTSRLKPDEEGAMIVDLREHRETGHTTAKHALMDLRLYLEIPWPAESPVQNPSRHEINLFFKYYDPQAESLKYVGHRYVPKSLKVSQIFPLMAQLAGLPPDTPLQAYEEVKWEPTVMICAIDPQATLHQQAQLESGDIICFQKAVPDLPPGHPAAAAADSSGLIKAASDGMELDEGAAEQQQQQQASQQAAQQQQDLQQQVQQQQQLAEGVQQHPHAELVKCRYPRVPEFLSYIRNRRLVTFRRLEEPKEPGLQLELLREDSYDTVAAALASKLGVADPAQLRLTQHNAYSNMPQRTPMKYRGVAALHQMLQHAGHLTDTLYYEALDMPLPQLEQLKSLRVHFHNDRTEFVGEHVVRLPRDSSVGDVLRDLGSRLGADYAGRQLRLLEVYHSKIYKVNEPEEEIVNMNENYWLIRAEPVAADEAPPLPPGHRLIHVYHISSPKPDPAAAAAANNNGAALPDGSAAAALATPANSGGGGFVGGSGAAGSVATFGDPFLLRIAPDETLGQVKARIQQKLGIATADFESWRAAFVSIRAAPEFLDDDEVLASRFAAADSQHAVAESNYLGLQHEDKGVRRPAATANRYNYERPVKIYNDSRQLQLGRGSVSGIAGGSGVSALAVAAAVLGVCQGAGSAAEAQPTISSISQLPAAAAASEPQVTAQSGPAYDAFKSITADALSSLLHKGKKEELPVALPAPAQPVATIVVPPQQVAAVPTTTSGISLKTDTPVTVASPINVTTPVKQKNVQLDMGNIGGGGEDFLNTLINLGNLGANSAAAGGAIAGAVAGFLNTFLPDCPPPIDDAPPIPGCQLIEGLDGLISGAAGGQPLSSTVVNVNSPNAVGAEVTASRPAAAAAGGSSPAAAAAARPTPPGDRPRPAPGPSGDDRAAPTTNKTPPGPTKDKEPPAPSSDKKPPGPTKDKEPPAPSSDKKPPGPTNDKKPPASVSGPSKPEGKLPSPMQVFQGIMGWP